jgi:hypothetical protein
MNHKVLASGVDDCVNHWPSPCRIEFALTFGNKVLFDPNPKQLPVLLDQHPNLFVYGNRGGGKSLVLRWLAHQMANQHPGFQYAFLHRSFPELNRTHLIPIDSEMKTFWHDGKQSSYHHTDHIAKYSNGSLGFYMVCDSEADVKKALGSNLSMCVFEEACESPLGLDGPHRRIGACVGRCALQRQGRLPGQPDWREHRRSLVLRGHEGCGSHQRSHLRPERLARDPVAARRQSQDQPRCLHQATGAAVW